MRLTISPLTFAACLRSLHRFVRRLWYRPVMKFAHRFHWHYAPPIYPEGDTQLWCQWCGFRQTVKRRGDRDAITPNAGLSGSGGPGQSDVGQMKTEPESAPGRAVRPILEQRT